MAIGKIKPQWRATCDICGKEAVQEVNKLPEGWVAVVEGGSGSQITFDNGDKYRAVIPPIAYVEGRVNTVICPVCRLKED